MNISASTSGRLLTLAGSAAVSGGGDVAVYLDESPLRVVDNDDSATEVPVSGALDGIAHVDARGLSGVGISLRDSDSEVNRIMATAGSDHILTRGGDDVINALGGWDFVNAGDGDDRIVGGGGDDRLLGERGNDVLIGGRGHDHVQGGFGEDTAIYTGNRADYLLRSDRGIYWLLDRRVGSPDGNDLIESVETLQFADQEVQLSYTVSSISASTSDHLLTISGPAAVAGGPRVFVGLDEISVAVEDNDQFYTDVFVDGGLGGVTDVDARGLTGAGIYIRDTALVDGLQPSNRIRATARNDSVESGGGHDVIILFSGSDSVYAGAGNDRIFGGADSDIIRGEQGHDQLDGGRGSDVIDGGPGNDTAVYTGNRTDYDISIASGGYYTVRDLREHAPDGADTLFKVEYLQFADQLYTLPAII